MKLLLGQRITNHKYLYLLGSLLVYFIVRAIFHDPSLEFVINIFFSINIVASVLIIGINKRKVALIGIGLSLLTFMMIWIREFSPPNVSISMMATFASICFIAFINIVVLIHTFTQRNVTYETILGATCSYLLLGFLWSTLYGLVYQLNHDAFTFVVAGHSQSIHSPDFIYYSFVTLTTLGYGDVVPASDIAQTLSWIEAVSGQLFLTILVARIVGDYLSQRRVK